MTTAELEELQRNAGVRWVAFDAFRGIAVLLMLVDHVVLVCSGPAEIRSTITRAAMPMFFLLAGYLARRPKLRHAGIFVVGLLLPAVVPWIDSPNVLCWWACGVALLWAFDRFNVPVWLLAVAGLTWAANGWTQTDGTYDGLCLWGLMAVGAMLPRSAFEWAKYAPGWVAVLGRYPLSLYVGHLLCLQVLVLGFAA